ncbi:MAG TPA: hypothetical protein VFZ86_03205 [Thermoleophilia bacterium]|nr:hypothetical protein [Thermoleophilia bacterium]
MFGRIFGRGKDDQDQAVCAECGRTLLAGEWTQTVVDEHGEERLICSLCGQAYTGGSEPVAAAPTPANNGRVRETRSEARYDERPAQPEAPARAVRAESDAFWQALKEKDAQIEELKAELARAEAERQELAGQFARLGAAGAAGAAAPDEPGSLTGDSSEPGERTWGETPAEFAAEMAALNEADAASDRPQDVWDEPAQDLAVEAPPAEELVEGASATGEPAEAAVEEDAVSAPDAESPAGAPAAVSATVFEDTQPIPAVPEDLDEDEGSTGEIAAAEAEAAFAAGAALPGEPTEQEPAAPSAAEAEAVAASLTLLQRGVDLLNVSGVPRKIAETNEQLGLPHVHAGFDDDIVAVSFMWTMGWYRFHVDIDSGDVTMHDRGYEELTLQPNAGVRADGTVQLAPAQISRAAAQRAQAAPAPASPEPAQPAAQPLAAPAEPETPREAAQKPPEFLSKSLLGQRSDDETASWEQTTARDFDWDR